MQHRIIHIAGHHSKGMAAILRQRDMLAGCGKRRRIIHRHHCDIDADAVAGPGLIAQAQGEHIRAIIVRRRHIMRQPGSINGCQAVGCCQQYIKTLAVAHIRIEPCQLHAIDDVFRHVQRGRRSRRDAMICRCSDQRWIVHRRDGNHNLRRGAAAVRVSNRVGEAVLTVEVGQWRVTEAAIAEVADTRARDGISIDGTQSQWIAVGIRIVQQHVAGRYRGIFRRSGIIICGQRREVVGRTHQFIGYIQAGLIVGGLRICLRHADTGCGGGYTTVHCPHIDDYRGSRASSKRTKLTLHHTGSLCACAMRCAG